jgi:hypothetical protein
MPLPIATLTQIEQLYNIKLTDEQANFLNIMYGRDPSITWRLRDYVWGLHIALKIYPANGQSPRFLPPPVFEQIKLDSIDGFFGNSF